MVTIASYYIIWLKKKSFPKMKSQLMHNLNGNHKWRMGKYPIVRRPDLPTYRGYTVL